MSKSTNFEDVFHHTQNLCLYDDLRSASFEIPVSEHRYEGIADSASQQDTIGRMTTYGQMLNPNCYDGKTNPRIWINHYEAIADANFWMMT